MKSHILSERIGLSRFAIMDYENKKTKPDVGRIKQLRKEHGYTQKQLGNLLGVNRRTVERWEKGVHKVNQDVYENMIKQKLL